MVIKIFNVMHEWNSRTCTSWNFSFYWDYVTAGLAPHPPAIDSRALVCPILPCMVWTMAWSELAFQCLHKCQPEKKKSWNSWTIKNPGKDLPTWVNLALFSFAKEPPVSKLSVRLSHAGLGHDIRRISTKGKPTHQNTWILLQLQYQYVQDSFQLVWI